MRIQFPVSPLPWGEKVRVRGLSAGPKIRGLRPAFTLIELIIVIAIIAVLAALTTGVAMRFYGIQQQRNSEVTITKVYEGLKEQWDTVIRQAKEEPISAQAWTIANYGGGSANDQARVIHIKLRLKQEFPMDFTEIISPYPTDLPPLPTYQAAVSAMLNAGSIPWYQPSATYVVSPLENSTCLYLALQRARGGASFNFDYLGSNAVASDDTGYQKWIVDGWRTPVVYYRWATKNAELDGLNPAPQGTPQFVYRDTQDPTGALFSHDWWVANHNWTTNAATSRWTPFEVQLHSLIQFQLTTPGNPTWPYVPQTGTPFPGNSGPFPSSATIPPPPPYFVWAYEYYTVPVVASAGPNKNFGIAFPGLNNPAPGTFFSFPNPMLSDGSGDDNDNIYSYRLRLGARGD